uniref:Putative lipocalin-9 1 lipocalin n=1 Tax=Rhipicephalus microplus TaxID=6941 RepID=A0A6M2CJ10_RHIMP
MIAVKAIILFAHLYASATDSVMTGLCTDEHAGEGAIDGFKFLQEDMRVDLVMTSLTEVLKHPDGDSVKCITALTITKDEDTHEVTEVVSYKRGVEEKWEHFGQTYKFEQPEGEANYVTMNNTQLSGAPSGIYTFTYVLKDCAVVTVKAFGTRLDEMEPAERSDENEEDRRPDCIVWQKQNTNRATEKCCEKHFTAMCRPKNKGYEYNPNKCGTPIIDEEHSEL